MKPTGDVVCEAIYCSVSESRDRCEPVEVKDGLACGVGKVRCVGSGGEVCGVGQVRD